MQLTIVSGRSGSGKSITLRVLEDLGYTCIDNCPITLLPALLNERAQSESPTAISLDARNFPKDSRELEAVSELLKQYGPVKVLYLDAKDETLLKRFGETRRTHPLACQRRTLLEALQEEGRLLTPIAQAAHIVLDTTDYSVAQISSRIADICGDISKTNLQLVLCSFGYKYGKPLDADMIFDVRCLPNPYWVPELRDFSGLDSEVQTYLESKSTVQKMIVDIDVFLEKWIPQFEDENRCYLTVAVGCTGGRHRSVYVTERLFSLSQSRYPQVQLRHQHLQT